MLMVYQMASPHLFNSLPPGNSCPYMRTMSYHLQQMQVASVFFFFKDTIQQQTVTIFHSFHDQELPEKKLPNSGILPEGLQGGSPESVSRITTGCHKPRYMFKVDVGWWQSVHSKHLHTPSPDTQHVIYQTALTFLHTTFRCSLLVLIWIYILFLFLQTGKQNLYQFSYRL